MGGKTQRCGPGMAAIIPPHGKHSVVAVTNGRAIVVDHPLREGF
jgi:quercetin dioxygenase-like cupin family protein